MCYIEEPLPSLTDLKKKNPHFKVFTRSIVIPKCSLEELLHQTNSYKKDKRIRMVTQKNQDNYLKYIFSYGLSEMNLKLIVNDDHKNWGL